MGLHSQALISGLNQPKLSDLPLSQGLMAAIDVTSQEQKGDDRKRPFDQISQPARVDWLSRWTSFDCFEKLKGVDHNLEDKIEDYDYMLPIVLLQHIADYPPKGRELAELFSVVVKYKDKKAHSLYGVIGIYRFGLPIKHLFYRDRENPILIAEGSSTTNLLLSGPDRCISVTDPCDIWVELYDNDTGEKIRQCVSCNIDGHEYKCDVLTSKSFCDGNLSVEVKFALFSKAVPAFVEVTLKKPRASTNVQGQLTASCDRIVEGGETMLFDKSKDEDVEVVNSTSMVIPLSRSAVAVPLGSTLVVKSALFDRDGGGIAAGSARFLVQSFGIFEENINGMDGEICVKVTFKLYAVVDPKTLEK